MKNIRGKHYYWAKLSTMEVADFILTLGEIFKERRIEDMIYSEGDELPENIISLYLYYVNNLYKRDYQLVVEDFKKAYIENELNVEPGAGPFEDVGLGYIYDYIGSYDFSKKVPNVFLEGMKLHMLLYSACPHPEFGGKLRMDPVRLKGIDYKVPDAEEARRDFQSYVTKNIEVDEANIFAYIDECIDICVHLIGVQPFPDGNKRTLRGLLNLFFARIGIPPIYIKESEKEIYREILMDALVTKDNKLITRFYYCKICEAIVDVNVHYFQKISAGDESEVGKRFVIEKKSDEDK